MPELGDMFQGGNIGNLIGLLMKLFGKKKDEAAPGVVTPNQAPSPKPWEVPQEPSSAPPTMIPPQIGGPAAPPSDPVTDALMLAERLRKQRELLAGGQPGTPGVGGWSGVPPNR